MKDRKERYSPEQLISGKVDYSREEPLESIVTDTEFHHKAENYVQHRQDEHGPGGAHQIEELHTFDITPLFLTPAHRLRFKLRHYPGSDGDWTGRKSFRKPTP